MINESNISKALQWLEDEGWTDLIYNWWTLEVYHELQQSGLELTAAEIREVLRITIMGEPDFDPENNEYLNPIKRQ